MIPRRLFQREEDAAECRRFSSSLCRDRRANSPPPTAPPLPLFARRLTQQMLNSSTAQPYTSPTPWCRLPSLAFSNSKHVVSAQGGGITWMDLDSVEHRYLLTAASDASIAAYDTWQPGASAVGETAEEDGNTDVAAAGAAAAAGGGPGGDSLRRGGGGGGGERSAPGAHPALFSIGRRSTQDAHRYSVTSVVWYPVDGGLFISGERAFLVMISISISISITISISDHCTQPAITSYYQPAHIKNQPTLTPQTTTTPTNHLQVRGTATSKSGMPTPSPWCRTFLSAPQFTLLPWPQPQPPTPLLLPALPTLPSRSVTSPPVLLPIYCEDIEAQCGQRHGLPSVSGTWLLADVMGG
jgi:hypothetical protein